VASASVTLTNPVLGYTASQSAGVGAVPDRSQAFFPNLTATTSAYQLLINAPGYDLVTTPATVSGDIVQYLRLAPTE